MLAQASGDVLSGQEVEDSHEYRYNYDKRGNLVLEENCQRTTQGNKWLREAAYEYNAANRLAIGTNELGEKSNKIKGRY